MKTENKGLGILKSIIFLAALIVVIIIDFGYEIFSPKKKGIDENRDAG